MPLDEQGERMIRPVRGGGDNLFFETALSSVILRCAQRASKDDRPELQNIVARHVHGGHLGGTERTLAALPAHDE